MKVVYDFGDPHDCLKAAEHLEKIIGTEAWGILLQLGERHFEIKIAQVQAGDATELARLRGRAEGVQALFADVQAVLKRAAAAGDRLAEQDARQLGGGNVVAMPGRGSFG